MQISPYLNFNGRCREAFEFYQKCLGGEIEMMMTHGDSPMSEQTPAEWRDAILHVSLLVNGQRLLGSDAPPQYFKQPEGFSVSLVLTDVDEAERIFSTLAENGTVTMPMQQTFWALRFGMLVDQFGTPWLINCDNPA